MLKARSWTYPGLTLSWKCYLLKSQDVIFHSALANVRWFCWSGRPLVGKGLMAYPNSNPHIAYCLNISSWPFILHLIIANSKNLSKISCKGTLALEIRYEFKSFYNHFVYSSSRLFIIEQDDYGWKIIHTDVFRFPPHKSWLCAILGEYTICSPS